MTYVYDLILNFNSELYAFYEWKKDDEILHIKKINLIRISSKLYNEILDYHVILSDDFLLSIFNRCEYYDKRNINKIPYMVLVSDNYRVMGIKLDMNGKIVGLSSLLLDEEEDVLDIVNRLGEIKLALKKESKRNKNEYQTREEINIIKYIKKDLKASLKEKNLDKLKYLYFEYFNKQCNDIDKIYQELNSILDKEITSKHYDLYNLIKLSYVHKSA